MDLRGVEEVLMQALLIARKMRTVLAFGISSCQIRSKLLEQKTV